MTCLQECMVLFIPQSSYTSCCFHRTLRRRRAERGSTRPCTRSYPGSWSRTDPPSRLSGATCPKTTTWTATPSCRRCSLTCAWVCPVQVSPKNVCLIVPNDWTAYGVFFIISPPYLCTWSHLIDFSAKLIINKSAAEVKLNPTWLSCLETNK